MLAKAPAFVVIAYFLYVQKDKFHDQDESYFISFATVNCLPDQIIQAGIDILWVHLYLHELQDLTLTTRTAKNFKKNNLHLHSKTIFTAMVEKKEFNYDEIIFVNERLQRSLIRQQSHYLLRPFNLPDFYFNKITTFKIIDPEFYFFHLN